MIVRPFGTANRVVTAPKLSVIAAAACEPIGFECARQVTGAGTTDRRGSKHNGCPVFSFLIQQAPMMRFE